MHAACIVRAVQHVARQQPLTYVAKLRSNKNTLTELLSFSRLIGAVETLLFYFEKLDRSSSDALKNR